MTEKSEVSKLRYTNGLTGTNYRAGQRVSPNQVSAFSTGPMGPRAKTLHLILLCTYEILWVHFRMLSPKRDVWGWSSGVLGILGNGCTVTVQ